MRRTISAAVLLLAVAASTTGCGLFQKGKLGETVEYQLTVTGSAAQKVTYAYTGLTGDDKEIPVSEEVAAPQLPWTQKGVAQPGKIRLDVAATGGPASCTITVEKKVLAKKQVQAGAPLSCVATIKKP
jgi:hypothetical protein